MKMTLARRVAEPAWPYRLLVEADIPVLGRLMLESFRGTPDDEGEELPDAIAEVSRTFDGAYGRFMTDCSPAVENDGAIISVCLVTLIEEHGLPFVTFSMTHPAHRRRGLAAFLLTEAGNRLLDHGHEEVALVVTEANLPAMRMYEHLGFHVVT